MSKDNIIKLIQPGNVDDQLTEILRNGARALLAQAVEAEVADFLGKHADLKTADGHQRVVRHGHLPEREVMTGIGPVAVRQPRVRDREADATDPDRIRFSPSILPPYMRRSKSIETLLPILYLKGISTGDFSEALAALLGKDAAGLSASAIGRLKDGWLDEHTAWQRRDLSAKRYVYIWADGIHLQARLLSYFLSTPSPFYSSLLPPTTLLTTHSLSSRRRSACPPRRFRPRLDSTSTAATLVGRDVIEGSCHRARSSRHNLVFGRSVGPDHDAVMRIGGEAPRRRAHSGKRLQSQACFGSPPPRIVIGHRRMFCSSASESLSFLSRSSLTPLRNTTPAGHLASRCQTPQGDQQLARQSYDHCLARVCGTLGSSRYHWANALSF